MLGLFEVFSYSACHWVLVRLLKLTLAFRIGHLTRIVLARGRPVITSQSDFLQELRLGLVSIGQLLVDGCIRCLFSHLRRLPTLQDLIEDIVGVFPPFSREEWYDIASVTFHFSLRHLFARPSHEVSCLPILFNISLHTWVLRRIVTLLEIALFAKNLAR